MGCLRTDSKGYSKFNELKFRRNEIMSKILIIGAYGGTARLVTARLLAETSHEDTSGFCFLITVIFTDSLALSNLISFKLVFSNS